MGKQALQLIQMSEHVTGYQSDPMPLCMPPALMKRLLGGCFPDIGFHWPAVAYFKQEDDGVWEPYNGCHELLPAPGFRITVNVAKL